MASSFALPHEVAAAVPAQLPNLDPPLSPQQNLGLSLLSVYLGHPTPQLEKLRKACGAAAPPTADQEPADAELNRACIHAAQRMLTGRTSFVVQLYGSMILHESRPIPALEADARQFRRIYAWTYENGAFEHHLAAAAQTAAFASDLAEAGEVEALQRLLERVGVSRNPPADWQPAHPEILLFPDERD